MSEIYKGIVAAAAEIAKTGIGKTRSNVQQGYKFRGIDDVYNELAPILARNHLCIFPRMQSREVVERQTRQGGTLLYVTVKAEFDFVSSLDASKHTVSMYGEAMDSADKATNKAMSAAYKYAAFQVFCIPTEGDNDADATTHEVAPPTPPPTLDPEILKALEKTATLDDLKAAWNAIPVGLRHGYSAAKDAAKTRIAKSAA